MLTKIWSMAVVGFHGAMLEVEVDLCKKLPQFNIVGLPDTAVNESRYRVRTAVKNSGYIFPYARILVNLAPANIKKQGPQYDLPIAIGLLVASGQLPKEKIEETVIIGELALDGSVRPVSGVLSMVIAAHKAGKKNIICPYENAVEAYSPGLLGVYAVKSLDETAAFFVDDFEPYVDETFGIKENPSCSTNIDYSQVVGQEAAKRAILISAAGHHHCLMSGSPGCGKSMIAMRVPTILPSLSRNESIETTQVHSIAQKLPSHSQLIEIPPFCNPHHTISEAGLVGGGSSPRPGEISLAHNGVLFLDELAEFSRRTLDMLRQPLESGWITISRAKESAQFPCKFLLVGAMNPCPCGYYGDTAKTCTCSPASILRYQKRLSGPLLDRFDLHINLSRVKYEYLAANASTTSSADLKDRVDIARRIQRSRLQPYHLSTNAEMSLDLIKKFCILSNIAQKLMQDAMDKLSLTARAYQKILKLSRTIADVEEKDDIGEQHVAEALQYRYISKSCHHL